MTRQRLEQILSAFERLRVALVGDFFIDDYLEIDPSLQETSLETGLTARQVVRLRRQPGAAGTVAANLRALGVGEVVCIGFVGDDGEGFELRRALDRMGARTEQLLTRADRLTPTYRKPIVRLDGGEVRELERLDTKNRGALPPDLEDELMGRVREIAPDVDGVIAQDQVQEAECGVITMGMRRLLAELAEAHPQAVWLGDSRERVAEYRNVVVKPNREECCKAVHPDSAAHSPASAIGCAATLSERVGASVYLTLGPEGLAVVTPESAQRIPTVKPEGEVDIVGAGDSVTAGIVSALCAGATAEEAGVVGTVAALVTIQQIGTTGVATREQVLDQFARTPEVWDTLPAPLSLA